MEGMPSIAQWMLLTFHSGITLGCGLGKHRMWENKKPETALPKIFYAMQDI